MPVAAFVMYMFGSSQQQRCPVMRLEWRWCGHGVDSVSIDAQAEADYFTTLQGVTAHASTLFTYLCYDVHIRICYTLPADLN